MQKGFTLMELVICLGLLGLFIAFTVPTGLDLYQRAQQGAIQEVLESAVRHARLNAMMDGSVWVLAPYGQDKDWSAGIGLYSLAAFKQIPRQKPRYQWSWPTKGSQVTWRGFQSQEALYFMPDVAHNAVNGTFLIKSSGQSEVKLVVSRLGYLHKI